MNSLEKEIIRNNSKIYRSILKNGYSNFRLEILEYCEVSLVLEREQYYLDKFNPEYNILRIAGSLRGFKHSDVTKERMSLVRKNSILLEETKLKIAATLSKGERILVKDLEKDVVLSFLSLRKAAEFIDIHTSYLSKTMKESGFYSSSQFFVYKSSNNLEDILKGEAYKKTILTATGVNSIKHTEASKQLIREANQGKKLSLETIQKSTLVKMPNQC